MTHFLRTLKNTSTARIGAALVLAAVLVQRPGSAQAQTCTGTNPEGTGPASNGLYAQYYAGYFNDAQNYFVGKTANKTQASPQLNFTTDDSFGDLVASGAASGTAANPEDFSGRYRGSFYAATSTTYTFYLYADDAAYLWLDNDALAPAPATSRAFINNGGLHAATTKQGSIFLLAGYHNVLVHYGENTGGNVLVLSYSTPTGTSPGPTPVPVPQSLLCTALQPLKNSSTALTYSPQLLTALQGTVSSSAVPTLTRNTFGNSSAPPIYELLAAPAGITINATTGVVTASAAAVSTYRLNVRVTTEVSDSYTNVLTVSVVDNPNTACAGANPGGGPASSGLYAGYYAGYYNDVQGFFADAQPGLERIDAQLNFPADNSWGNISPPASGSNDSPDLYSARYRGSLLISASGTYTFYLTSDDASSMWLDNPARRSVPLISEAFINNGGTHVPTTRAATVFLEAGKHDVLLHYGEQSGMNVLVLEYESVGAGIARTVVPSAVFCSSMRPAPLPVELTRFEATNADAGVLLNWATASEKNNDYFELERSATGRAFGVVGRVAGAGTTRNAQRYEWLDRTPLPGVGYYRLRQVDRDGTSAYSPVVAATRPGGPAAFQAQLLPNPVAAGGEVRVWVRQAEALPVQLAMSDAQGRALLTRQLPAAQASEAVVPLPGLPAGLYLVQVRSAAGVATLRLLVQ